MKKKKEQGCLSGLGGLILLVILAVIYSYLKEHLEVVGICLGAVCLVGGLWWLLRVLEKRKLQRQIEEEKRKRIEEEIRRQIKEEKRLHALRLADVDNMDGHEFERYVGRLLSHQGFQVEITQASADLGVDIIAQRDDIKYAIQVKRHAKKISRRAVSDAVAGKEHFNCNMAMVITNNYFSDGAKTLAKSTECELTDRDILANWILDFQRAGPDKPAGEVGAPCRLAEQVESDKAPPETKKAIEEADRRVGGRLWPWLALLSTFACIVALPVLIAMFSESEEQREQASSPTSVTTLTRRPTSTKQIYTLEPSTRLTTIAMTGRTPETNTPEPTPTSTQKPTTTLTPIIYIVKAGDTLSAIAKEFGVTVQALQEVNAISDPRRLQIGQELIIPKGETIAPAGTAIEVKPTSTPALAVTNTPTATKTTTVTPTPTSKPTATPSPTATVLGWLQQDSKEAQDVA